MPVPDIETWRARWTGEQVRYLGVRGVDIGDGYTEFVVEQPYGDERDDDPLFLSTAIMYAVDIAVVGAVGAHVDPLREQNNGTASLYLNWIAAPSGTVSVHAKIAHWGTFQALVEVTAHDDAGSLVAQGLSAYSLRPKPSTETAGTADAEPAEANR
jgi:acyl-coenzyme A thioesterase PaaI-like protein